MKETLKKCTRTYKTLLPLCCNTASVLLLAVFWGFIAQSEDIESKKEEKVDTSAYDPATFLDLQQDSLEKLQHPDAKKIVEVKKILEKIKDGSELKKTEASALFKKAFHILSTHAFSLLEDHALFLKAQGSTLKAQKSGGKKAESLKLYDAAFEAWARLLRRAPASLYTSKALDAMARVERKIAALLGAKQAKAADKLQACTMWSSSFYRKFPSVPFVIEDEQDFQAYSDTCSDTEDFAVWGDRIRSTAVKYPTDFSNLKFTLNKAPSVPKVSYRTVPVGKKLYSAVDQDRQALADAVDSFYGKRDYKNALAITTQALATMPLSAWRRHFSYFQGMSQKLLKHSEQSKKTFSQIFEQYPFAFHSIYSHLQEGLSIEFNAPLLRVSTSNDWVEMVQGLPSFAQKISFKRLIALYLEGAYSEALLEWGEVGFADHMPHEMVFLMLSLATKLGSYKGVFAATTELTARFGKNAVSPEVTRWFFPQRFLDEIQMQCPLLDPYLVLSLVHQESLFDAQAQSGAGALGLMQLMPTTAASLDPQIKTGDLLDPAKNITLGCKYLKNMIDTHKGNVIYAVASYNAGPNAVMRWKQDLKTDMMVYFMENIPYIETRNYVFSVVRNYLWYQALQNIPLGDVKKKLELWWK